MPVPLSLDALRKHAFAMRAAAFVLGLAALVLVALGHFWIALVVIAASRAAALLEPQEVFDTIFLSGAPFAFALADPSRALAATFALFGFVAVLIVSKRLDRIDALAGTAAALVACALPQWFSLIAYALGIAGFVTAGLRFSRTLS